jgi:N-acetylglucosaminyldiphosphoundecaprenol N-acetyl-beta-D-mannosaminyltransferase
MRTELFGAFIDNLSLEEAVGEIGRAIQSRRIIRYVAVNVHKVVMANRDPLFLKTINSSDLSTADGLPIVWMSRFFGGPLRERVSGIDLFLALLDEAQDKGYKVFLMGAQQDVLAKVVDGLRATHPGLRIVGSRDGYWSHVDEGGVVETIRAAAPDLLFVAMPSPRKELCMERWSKELQVPFVMGVGGSFDILAGKTKRAPPWMQKCCLEWFYRLLQEPRRMLIRYGFDGACFMGLIVREALKIRHSKGKTDAGGLALKEPREMAPRVGNGLCGERAS